MKIEVISLFPQLVEQVGGCGMPRRAIERGAVTLTSTDLCDYAQRLDGRIDERTFGGGPGMIMQPEPIMQAIESARKRSPDARFVLLSPQGNRLSQAWLERLAAESSIVLICGRYEGVDERISQMVDIELSLGDFVLSGGELAAMAVIDGVTRLLPGVLTNDSYAQNYSVGSGLLDHPHYTRPRWCRGQTVPKVLFSGDHAAIQRWRLQQALGLTWLKRPELLMDMELSEDQVDLLRTFITELREDTKRGGS